MAGSTGPPSRLELGAGLRECDHGRHGHVGLLETWVAGGDWRDITWVPALAGRRGRVACPVNGVEGVLQIRSPCSPVGPPVFLVHDCQDDEEDEDDGN